MNLNGKNTSALQCLRRDGFGAIERIVVGDELTELQAICDRWLGGGLSVPGDPTNHMVGGTLHQIFQPSKIEPFLAANSAIDNGMAFASEVFDDKSFLLYDSLICKPPGDPNEVPWHQDAAYEATPYARAGSTISSSVLQFWVPLDDVDIDNGCMHYMTGQQQNPLLPHQVIGGDPHDPTRMLGFDASVIVDVSRVVPLPLKAGDAAVHTLAAPHWTPPNKTADRFRRVYTFILCAARDRAEYEAISLDYDVSKRAGR